jgi:hypothetical protein
MKRACAWCVAGTVAGLALALTGCSGGSNPVLPTNVAAPDTGVGNRGVQIVPDSSPSEAALPRDSLDVPADAAPDAALADAGPADVALNREVAGDVVMGIDLPPPPRISVTILSPVAIPAEGGIADGGVVPPVVSTGSRFAPKVSVEVENRGGDPTADVLTQVKANLLTAKGESAGTAVSLNQVQYTVLPGSGIKSYLFSDTPIDLSKVGSGLYTLQIVATTIGGTTGSATMPIYIDGGPSISFLQPADGVFVKGSVVVSAVVSDAHAGIATVTFSVGQTDLPSGAVTSSGGLYTATIDFGSFDPPLDGAQVLTVTAVNGNGMISLATRRFTVDNTGPVISQTKPANGELVGRITSVEARVDDPAGVMSGSVVAVVAHGDIHFEVELIRGSDGTFRQSFDTTQLPVYAISPTVSFRAQDVLGNQSAVGYLVSLDNTPPILDLDPPANFRLYKKDGTCSWPFDPVGPDAVDDGSVVSQLFDIRARIQDLGNTPLTGTSDYIPIAAVDPAKVKVLILDDTSLPLVVDTSDPPDGICDDVNPEIIPSVSPQSSKEAQLLDMVPLSSNVGAGDFTFEPGSTCSGTDANPPDAFCPTTYSLLKNRSMTYSLGYTPAGLPAIWTVGPVVGDSLQCAGRQFDASNNLRDGWACIAVVAADRLGNKQVSRPIRICVAAQTDSTACTPTALGGAMLTSVTLPNSRPGKVSVETSAPLLDVAGAPLGEDAPVIFSNLGPLAIARISGTHYVTPQNEEGTSFALSDSSISPAILLVDMGDGGAAVSKGAVGLVLRDGAPLHVVTTDATALAQDFQGKVLLLNAGVSGTSKWVPTNIDASGFDLAGITVQLSGGAIPVARMPDCTGTVIKQSSGLPAKVDGTQPCQAWAAYPPSEGKRI